MKEELTDERALQGLLLDIDCLDELHPWTCKLNIFDVLKISRTEIRHSNMLSWLLDPSENHGLGDAFLKSIFQRLVENDAENRYIVFDILLMDFYSFNVYREWKNIDLLLVSHEEKCVMVIENKLGSREHDNQLNRYREIIEKEYPEYTKIYVFLTPDGEEPSDVENWDTLSYSDVIDTLEMVFNRFELQEDVSLLIRNYIEIVRRDIVEDQQLIDICNKIYQKHQKALDLIFENKTEVGNIVVETIRETMRNNKDIIPGKLASNKHFLFTTQRMTDYYGKMENENSSWGDAYPYRYWLSLNEGRLLGHFELGGNNVSDEIMEKHQLVTSILKPSDNRGDEFKYKRIYRTKLYNVKETDDESEIKKKVNAIIKELLMMEDELFKKI